MSAGDDKEPIVSGDAPPIPDPCYKCAHFRGILVQETNEFEEGESDVYCDAFPNGIPHVIQKGFGRNFVPLGAGKTITIR